MDELRTEDMNHYLNRKEVAIPDWDTDVSNFYKPVAEDRFPLAAYILSKTGRHPDMVFEMQESQHCVKYKQILDYLGSNGYVCIHSYIRFLIKECPVNYKRMLFEKRTDTGIILCELGGVPYDFVGDDSIECSVNLYAADMEFDFNALKEVIKNSVKEYSPKINNINLVITTQRGYSTTPFELPKTQLDLNLNYGSSFIPVHEKIIKELNRKNGKGLVLLHGLPGTGKTHYLKYLASKVKNKSVLFIPPYLADFIVSPEMTPFLIDNSNSILFIEDAERVISDRSVNSSTGVSNILNLTDGILSDILNIQVVATFNMDKQKIDPALLRKGRLIAEHKFDALSKEDSQKLLDKLNIDHTATTTMTLTDIYNVKEAEYKSEDRTRIGFHR